MRKEQIATVLYESAELNGLIPTLASVFGRNLKVSIPFSKRAVEKGVDEIEFSVRAANALKRAGVFRIGEIIDAINDGRITSIRNLGKKTFGEIETKLLLYGYEQLNSREKYAFLMNLIANNF